MTFFWDVAPCSLVEVYRRFREAYCLSLRGDDGPEDGAVITSKTSANFYETTRRKVPEDDHLHILRREDKCHLWRIIYTI
jgi:hypothetical protein